MFTVLAGLGLLIWLHVGTWAVIVLAVVIVVLLLVWRHRHRSSYERLVANRARRAARSWWAYKRRWKSAMVLAGLAAVFERERYAPKIRKIRSDKHADHLLVRLLSGQEPADFENRAEALANTFGAFVLPGARRSAGADLAGLHAPRPTRPGRPGARRA